MITAVMTSAGVKWIMRAAVAVISGMLTAYLMYLLRCRPEDDRLRAGDGLDGFLSGTRPSDLI